MGVYEYRYGPASGWEFAGVARAPRNMGGNWEADIVDVYRRKKSKTNGSTSDGSGGKASHHSGGDVSSYSGFADALAKAGKGNLDYASDWYKYLIGKTKSIYDPLVDRYTRELAGLEPKATDLAQYGMDIAKKALGGWYPSQYDTWMGEVIRNAREQALREMQYNQRQSIGDVLNRLAQRGALSSSVNVDAQRQLGESANRNIANLENKLYQWKGNTQIGLPKQIQSMGQSLSQNAMNILKPKMATLGSTLEARGDLLNHIGAGQGLIDAARTYPAMMDPYLKDIQYAQSAFNLANAPLLLQSQLIGAAMSPIMSTSGPSVNMPTYGSSGIFSGLGSVLGSSLGDLFPSNTVNIAGNPWNWSSEDWGGWNLF